MLVYSIQNDTLDAIAYRYFGTNTAEILPEIMALNPHITDVILLENQAVHLPEFTSKPQSETLKLWD